MDQKDQSSPVMNRSLNLPSQTTISPINSPAQQTTLTNSDHAAIDATLGALGMRPAKNNNSNEKFLAELNYAGASTKNVAQQVSSILNNSNSDSCRLAAAKMILAVNGVSFNEDRPAVIPQINIVLNNGIEDRRIAEMLNPR
jgi:hypothetical protein